MRSAKCSARAITDSELSAAIDGAFDLWQSRYEGDLPTHTFSAGFEEKAAAIPDTVRPSARRPLRAAVAVAAIAATLTMTIGADVVPAPTFFQRGSIHVEEQILHKSTDRHITSDYDHEGETRRPVLNWLPEDWVEEDRSVFKNSTMISFQDKNKTIDRHKNTLSIRTQRITATSSTTTSTNTENAEVSTIRINDNEAMLVIRPDCVILKWFIENYSCTIIGPFPAETIIKIAENMELK